jgi:hypothetical protein
MTQTQKALLVPAFAMLMILGGAIAGYAQLSSASDDNRNINMGMMHGMVGNRGEGIHGTIIAMSGEMLTVKSIDGTVYTVTASNAEVYTFAHDTRKEATLSDLSVGDAIGIHGEVDGTTITAEHIMDGAGERGMGRSMGRGERGSMRGGNGVMGEVTNIDGNTITVAAPNGTMYTVNAEHAEVERFTEGSLGDIHEGSHIGVHGDRNGTTVMAERIMADIPEAFEKISN